MATSDSENIASLGSHKPKYPYKQQIDWQLTTDNVE